MIHYKAAPKKCMKCGKTLDSHTELEGSYRASWTVKFRFCNNKQCKEYKTKKEP